MLAKTLESSWDIEPTKNIKMNMFSEIEHVWSMSSPHPGMVVPCLGIFSYSNIARDPRYQGGAACLGIVVPCSGIVVPCFVRALSPSGLCSKTED